METFLRSIDAVKGSTGGTGFAAIKLTALGRPEILVNGCIAEN
jgi:proline dehydrogenase